MGTEIDLHHVSLLEHHLVSSVGRVVGSTVVNAETTRESHTSLDVVSLLQSWVAGQGANRILDALRNLRESLTRLDVLLSILADLAMDLSSLTVLLQEVVVHAVEVTLLFIGGPVGVVVLVLDNLSLRILVVREELGDRDTGRRTLDLCTSLLLLGLALLLFLGGYFKG